MKWQITTETRVWREALVEADSLVEALNLAVEDSRAWGSDQPDLSFGAWRTSDGEAPCPTCARSRCYGLVGHVVERLAWAARTAWHASPASLTARRRLLWHDFIVHGLLNKGGERCQDCGRSYALWHADDDAWPRVMAGDGGLLCRSCWGVRVIEWTGASVDDWPRAQ